MVNSSSNTSINNGWAAQPFRNSSTRPCKNHPQSQPYDMQCIASCFFPSEKEQEEKKLVVVKKFRSSHSCHTKPAHPSVPIAWLFSKLPQLRKRRCFSP